jgi:alpha-1,2-mannosyltransferase
MPQIPVIGIDSLAYGRVVVVPWNIIKYNIFGGSERGPELYGTSPWYFYILNLLLNFNVLVPLALMSLPSLAVTYMTDSMRLGIVRSSADQSSPFTMLGLRLLPFYVWIGILTLQAHKEERFVFPAYPMLCFNAAVTLYLVRGWMEAAFISITKSPYRVRQCCYLHREKAHIKSGFENNLIPYIYTLRARVHFNSFPVPDYRSLEVLSCSFIGDCQL